MNKEQLSYPDTLSWKILEGSFRLAECLFIPELFMQLNRVFKPRTRRLTGDEIALAGTVFNNTIDYNRVRVDEHACIGCRQYHFAYVGFNVINCWGRLSSAHFVHEMMHVWQYQHLGAVYIPRALWAQRTPAGYNYGGIESLKKALAMGKGILSFNYEQQADIIADFYCLKNKIKPRWCPPNPEYLPVFEAIVKEILSP